MPSTTVDGKIIQVIKLVICDTPACSTKKELRGLFVRLKSYEGWTQIYWSSPIDRSDIFNIFIVWDSVAEADLFTSSLDYLKIFPKLTVSGPTYVYYDLNGSMSSGHPAEIMSFYFPKDSITPHEMDLFKNEAEKAVSSMETHLVSAAQGWNSPIATTSNLPSPSKSEGELYVILISWKSLEVNHTIMRYLEGVFTPLRDDPKGNYATNDIFFNIDRKDRAELDRLCAIM